MAINTDINIRCLTSVPSDLEELLQEIRTQQHADVGLGNEQKALPSEDREQS